ncbi:MAG: MarR family transcriptional regulator [Candidatus Bathyarchaeota archaeon]|nr:MarR family transcriptional regulator [Candidatus Bathyarchaeota archaeon]
MSPRLTVLACALCILMALALPFAEVHAQNYVKYKVQVNVDGSAEWTITEASDLTVTVSTWKEFQQKIAELIDSAANTTQREMSLDPDSLQMNTVWGTSSHTTQYNFIWLNFSIVQDEQILFGDVFHVDTFFSKLYGDGELEVTYPSAYSVQSASPQPNGDEDTPHTLDWLGTQFFVNGNPNIVLASAEASPTPDPKENSRRINIPFSVAISIAVVASLGTLYFTKLRKHKPTKQNQSTTSPLFAGETEEEKILKVLQASGGSAYQSDITQKCRFSKAKTSQLLTALEKKGIVTRYKKGRDKIVTLSNQGKGEKP